MKKLSIMIMALALVLGMAQCKKQTEQQANEPAGATMDVTVRVQGNTEKTDITSTGVVTWKQGDKLYVVGESQGLLGYVSARADGDPATFSGTITALTSAQTLRFYYVGDKSFTLNGDNYTFDLGSQDGSLAGIAAHSQLMWGKTTGTIAVGTIDFGTITMTSLMSIAHLNINDGGAAVSGPFAVTGGFATSTFNAKTYDGAALTGTAGNITMTFASGTTSTNCYLALLPGTQTLKFSADGKEATLAAKDIAANTFYNAGSPVAVAVTESPYVDLGLPSGLLWATCNLGAEHPYDYGNYYAWGETAGYNEAMVGAGANCGSSYNPGTVKTNYEWDYYKWGSGSKSLGKYVDKAGYGMTPPDNKTVLDAEDDAARAVWGGDWRMPTADEFNELIRYTTRTWKAADASITIAGQSVSMPVAGYYCESKKTGFTGKYIFLPAAGVLRGWSVNNAGNLGIYWSSSLDTRYNYYGMNLYSASNLMQVGSDRYRYVGLPVRPVMAPQN